MKAENNVSVPPKARKVTIHDVAQHAGVSSMTASRAVNDQQYVRPELRDRVMTAVRELGYTPNLAARAARSGSLLVGLLYSNPASSNLNGFLMGAFKEAASSGCQLVIEPTATHADNLAAVKAMLRKGIDAIVLPPPLCDDEKVCKLLNKEGVTAIAFTTASPRSDTSAVLVDDYRGAKLMAERLIALGHRDIAFIKGDNSHSTARKREEGYRDAMVEAGLPLREDWTVDGDYTYRGGLAAGQRLLSAGPRPTAIFASNDDMAAAVLAVAHGLGIDVPAELSVSGFDDTPVATTVWPALTTVHQSIADMAGEAVRSAADAVRRKRAGDTVAVVHHFADLTLVERSSTGPAPSIQHLCDKTDIDI